VERERLQYNEAVRQTWNEEFLLNIVRLRYRDPVEFDAVTTITAQHELDAAVNGFGERRTPGDYRVLTGSPAVMRGATVLIPGVGPAVSGLFNLLHYGGNTGISERPTLTYSPLEGSEFTRSLASPIHLESVVLLSSTGWDIDRVLRLTVQQMNGLENAPFLGWVPERAPPFEGFNAVAAGMRELQHRGVLELSYHDFERPLSEPWEEKQSPSPNELINAAEKKFEFRKVSKIAGKDREKDRVEIILYGRERAPVLRIAEGAWHHSPEVAQVANALHLTPGLVNYQLTRGAEIGRLKAPATPGAELVVSPRSVLAMLILASRGIEVPQKHYDQGLVGATLDANGQPFDWTRVTTDLFRVRSSKIKPLHAFVCVKYRGYWFYIEDDDLSSKTTFGMIIEVLGLELAGGIVPGPVLTVPVGGGLQQTIPGATGGGGGGGGGGRGSRG
jgi:hypothetical protein